MTHVRACTLIFSEVWLMFSWERCCLLTRLVCLTKIQKVNMSLITNRQGIWFITNTCYDTMYCYMDLWNLCNITTTNTWEKNVCWLLSAIVCFVLNSALFSVYLICYYFVGSPFHIFSDLLSGQQNAQMAAEILGDELQVPSITPVQAPHSLS